jgi:hypothetical protein
MIDLTETEKKNSLVWQKFHMMSENEVYHAIHEYLRIATGSPLDFLISCFEKGIEIERGKR